MVLVTGGTGLVGAHLLYDLCKMGQSPRAIKRANSDLTFLQNIFHFYAGDNSQELLNRIEWVEADLLDVDSLIDATEGISEVYHAAAIVSFQKKERDFILKANIEGTANLITACQENGIRKLGHVSSISTLGPIQDGEVGDESNLWEVSKYNTTYAISKYGAEREVWRAAEEGLSVVIVNPGIILGPGDWNRSSTAIFKTAYDGIKFYTTGSTGVIDVRDISRCLIELVDSDIEKERYILVSESLGYRSMFDQICTHFNIPKPTKKATPFKAGLAWRLAKVQSWFTARTPVLTRESVRTAMKNRDYSNRKIVEAIDFKFTPAEKSISETVDFLKKYYVND